MADEDKRAAQYHKEAADYLSPTPSPKNLEKMREQVEEDRQRRLSKEAYDKASPFGKSIPEKKAKGGSIRGGGCETRGKTKGRFV
jgi:hypothetical protein